MKKARINSLITRAVPMIGSLAFCSAALAADLYVSPSGNDKNPGTQEKPIASMSRAVEKVQPHAGKTPITVHFSDGIYYLPDTVVFSPEDSGTEKSPIIYKAETEGGAVLSGGSKLDLQWKPYRDGIFMAKTPAGLVIDQLFINGKNQRMARYPNYDPAKKAEPYQGYAADAFAKERAADWADPTGGYIHAMHRSGWGGYHYLITGKDASGEVTYEGGWQNNRKMGMHKDHRMVENIFEELDAPGEWYHNAKTSTLYYFPMSGTDLKNATVEVVRLRHLIEFQGSEVTPVQHITLQGFTVRHAARTFMDTKEQMVRSDWAIYRGGAFMLTGTEDVSILDCEFDQVGGNAVFVNNYNRGTLVKGCHIHDTGASGVCFVGDPNALYDPLFEYGEKNDLSKIDRTPGPKTQNFPSLGTVEDCLIHGIGRVERQPAGVQIEMASEITVRDCSIYDCARAGINIGDGAFGGHLIERCDVFDTVLETHDHGSFNSWGRDRYWRSDHLTASQAAVDADPDLPFLDAWKTTVIRDSRWRCDHGWDIDLDDGSSNYDIYNNLMLGKGLKLREGYRRHAWNNVIPFGGFHPHVWFKKSKDQVYSNIFSERHRPARMNEPYTDETMVDRNFYNMPNDQAIKAAAKQGWDKNSIFGNPEFIDPVHGDFRVRDDSPALKLGFVNFPMDQFGVKKPSLKALAETPVIPELASPAKKPAKGKMEAKETPFKNVLFGAVLKDLEGEEFSAFGVSKDEGGVVLEKVPQHSVASKAGLKSGDLIQGVNGKSVKNTDQLFQALEEGGPVKLKVVRNQQLIEVQVKPNAYVVVDTADSESGFSKLPLRGASSFVVTAKPKTNNEPLETLVDGKLAENFGAVFGNGVNNGLYKIDLGAPTPVHAITSWTHNQNGSRGVQKLTLYGSNDVVDPGWELDDYTPLGTIDTGKTAGKFTAASLRAVDGQKLGTFRWIVWAVSPVHERGGGENTAFQEFTVERGQ
ncbi:right-handed parallel beta-helix repeat-containing protein [Pontiellaceae bacterium B1224]|nr:right-handed parallel beta-helix repeat-containing protein [Pontiellaceae bacterium B1224]